MSQVSHATRILHSASEGDASATKELLPLVYNELRRLAAAYLGDGRDHHTLQATALVNEAYLRLIDSKAVAPGDREHFVAVAAKTMRHVLVDYHRGQGAQKRGGDRARVPLITNHADESRAEFDLVELNDLLEQLASVDARAAQVVELRFFGGLSIPDTGAVMGTSRRSVESDWFFARSWLSRELKR